MDAAFSRELTAERDAVLSSAVFSRSPVLSGLLVYLVNETIEGRASTLKSFIVAVDALGRKEDFDSASDSSARVQMGRLRKTLENYYAQNAPGNGVCIYLLPGSYIVRLDNRTVAYPTFPPLMSNEKREFSVPSEINLQPQPKTFLNMFDANIFRRTYLLPLLLLFAITLTAAAGLFTHSEPAKASLYRSPILEIVPIESDENTEAKQTSRLVASILADDLSRFKASRVRLGMGGSTNAEGNIYRLYSRLVTNNENQVTLYLNIDDARANVLIWSRTVIMPPNSVAASSALAPITAEINGPQGIISSYESILASESSDGGYPCLLKYFEFARFHEKILEDRVATCLDKPVAEPRLVGTMLGVRAMFEVERSSAVQNMDAAFERGISLARVSVKADANDGWANFAMARLSFLKRDCSSARFYTARTIAANPNSPIFSSVLAGLAPICDYPLAGKLLDQAIATQSPYYAKSRLLLVLSAISQKRPEKINEIFESELPLSRDNRSNYYLTEAMIAASKNDRSKAARYWSLFEANAPKQNKTADDKLRNIIMIPDVRRQVIDYLRDAGVSIS